MPPTPDQHRHRWVVHYREIGIKGDNRIFFERRLMDNIRQAIRGIEVRRPHGRLLAYGDGLDPDHVERRLAELPGIGHFAPAVVTSLDPDEIRREAVTMARELVGKTFAVRTRRSYKGFPFTSVELNRDVGAAINLATGMAVDLEQPDHTVHIEIIDDQAILWSRRIPGVGGLPVGVSGRVIVLLSGGIDSPVAAYKLMRRGCPATLLHFHNYSRHQDQVRTKIIDLAQALARYQQSVRLYLVPFAELQSAIVAAVPPAARMITYRRVMVRIGQTLLAREGGLALVTGDAVGQVASQTLENLTAIQTGATVPILSPLIGDEKDEIVRLARAIGTYEISVRPYEDCCSFLVARHPDTQVNLPLLLQLEARIPIDELAAKALAEAEIHELKTER